MRRVAGRGDNNEKAKKGFALGELEGGWHRGVW